MDQVLEAIVRDIPAPSGDVNAPLQALVFDSLYDSYRGVIAFVSIKQGRVAVGDKIRFMAGKGEYEVLEVGVRTPKEVKKDVLSLRTRSAGSPQPSRTSRTCMSVIRSPMPCVLPMRRCRAMRRMNPMVYCGLYPVDNAKYNDLRDALEKLKLNDAALQFEPETSQALGFGFPLRFLGHAAYGCRAGTHRTRV